MLRIIEYLSKNSPKRLYDLKGFKTIFEKTTKANKINRNTLDCTQGNEKNLPNTTFLWIILSLCLRQTHKLYGELKLTGETDWLIAAWL